MNQNNVYDSDLLGVDGLVSVTRESLSPSDSRSVITS